MISPKNLSQNQRLIVAIVYLGILFLIFVYIGGDFYQFAFNTNSDSSVWFYSGAFMIILGAYVVEPFFTKPSDSIANSIAILISLFGLSSKKDLFGYYFIFYYALVVLTGSIVVILLKDAKLNVIKKIDKVLYWFVERFGSAKVIFSIVYLSAAYSYFATPDKIPGFISIIALWICLTFFDVIGLIAVNISDLITYLKNKSDTELGVAIGCENPFLYKVEVGSLKYKQVFKCGSLVAVETSTNIGSVGIIIDIKYLLNKKWLSVYLLQDDNNQPVKIDLKSRKLVSEEGSVFSKQNLVYLLEFSKLEDISMQEKISQSILYKNKDSFIGYVSSGSNINTINFSLLMGTADLGQKISEGVILKTRIYSQETFYQVINGSSREEHLENFDRHGFIVGVAKKLGKYNFSLKELDVSKWMPDTFSPVFLLSQSELSEDRIRQIAEHSIGRLPGTDLEIPIKDYNALITHNSAILGILGIGKSCLTFELIKKIFLNTTSKIICFDISGEYFDELTTYGCPTKKLDVDTLQHELQTDYASINKDIHKGGNHNQFRASAVLFLKDFLDSSDRALVINPEDFDVSKQTNDVKAKKVGPGQGDWQDQAPMADLTVVEKVRILAEVILEYAKNKGKTKDARCLLVFEEAHSLVPEWNSVASDADKNATNGTAKVILQGRKYGIGSFVITQRTANVSKTVLNQCNTIFALRVFDDTGKSFLENYIGNEYSDTLASLEERHAVSIGRGLRLKQPVIIQLNDQKYFVQTPPAIGR